MHLSDPVVTSSHGESHSAPINSSAHQCFLCQPDACQREGRVKWENPIRTADLGRQAGNSRPEGAKWGSPHDRQKMPSKGNLDCLRFSSICDCPVVLMRSELVVRCEWLLPLSVVHRLDVWTAGPDSRQPTACAPSNQPHAESTGHHRTVSW